MKAVLFIMTPAFIILTGCKTKKDKYDFSKAQSISLDAYQPNGDIRIYPQETIILEKPLNNKKSDSINN